MNGSTYFIVNPHSANGRTAKRWPLIKQLLETELGSIDYVFTKGNIHATYLTGKALYDGYTKIVAVGGDGTLNEVLNGFYDSDKKINAEAVLGYYPSGTGQDFSQTLMIDRHSPAEHVRRLVRGEHKKIDIGQVTFHKPDGTQATRKYLNESSLGFGANVSRLANKSSKAGGGKLTYLSLILRALIFLKSYPLNIEVDGQKVFSGDSVITVLANGRYFGGSLMVAPAAKIDDSLLEIIIVKKMGRAEIIATLGSVYKGKHLTNPKIQSVQGKEIWITSSEEVWIEMDGEIVGVTKAHFRNLPQEISFIV